MRRLIPAVLAATVAALGASATASAAVVPGQFNLHFTSVKIVLGSLAEVQIPGADPALAGKAVDLNAGIDPAGTITAYRNALSFPPVGLSGVPLTIGLAQTSSSTGHFDDATNTLSLPLNIGVTVSSDLISGPCTIPLSFTLDNGSHDVVAGKTVAGAPYDPATGAITLAAVSTLPNVAALPAATCPADAAALIGVALPKGTPAGLQLSGTLSMPGGTAPADPDASCGAGGCTPPPCTTAECTPPAATCATDATKCAASVATLGGTALKVAKKRATATVRCAGTPATTKACTGTVTLKATYRYAATTKKKVRGKTRKVTVTKSRTVTVGKARYTAAAGGSASVAVAVPASVTRALKDKVNRKKLAAVLTVTNDNGTGVAKKKATLR
jgi:hypothetical protein